MEVHWAKKRRKKNKTATIYWLRTTEYTMSIWNTWSGEYMRCTINWLDFLFCAAYEWRNWNEMIESHKCQVVCVNRIIYYQAKRIRLHRRRSSCASAMNPIRAASMATAINLTRCCFFSFFLSFASHFKFNEWISMEN